MMDALQQTGEVIFHGIAVKPGKPTILGSAEVNRVNRLIGKTGTEFDRTYIDVVRQSLEDARDASRAEAKGGRDGDLKDFARKTQAATEQDLSALVARSR